MVIVGVLGALLGAAVTVAEYYRSEAGRARRDGDARAAWADARTAAVITEAESRMASVIAEAQGRIAEADSKVQTLDAATSERARDAKDSENRRAAALSAFAGAAGRMQAMSTSMLAELREMENRHGDPKVLADLLELDHRTAQAGRLADSIAVLSGARTGRRWAKPIAMESILRGAMGRVAGYQRVRLRAVTDIAIAGHAAEGVMHALAELLDNACNFSPPTTEVHVYAAEVPAGVVITIEDSGLVMSESALRRAESTVSGRTGGGSDLSSLSGTRLGLAVVGYLARKHELTVSYRPSAIGGTAVVIVVPRELTTRVDRTATLGSIPLPAAAIEQHSDRQQALPVRETAALPAAEPARALTDLETFATESAPATAPSGAVPSATELATTPSAAAPVTTSGLPKRRRGTTLAAVHPGGLPDMLPDGPDPQNSPLPLRQVSSPSALGAFQRAMNGRENAGAATSSPSVALEADQ